MLSSEDLRSKILTCAHEVCILKWYPAVASSICLADWLFRTLSPFKMLFDLICVGLEHRIHNCAWILVDEAVVLFRVVDSIVQSVDLLRTNFVVIGQPDIQFVWIVLLFYRTNLADIVVIARTNIIFVLEIVGNEVLVFLADAEQVEQSESPNEFVKSDGHSKNI